MADPTDLLLQIRDVHEPVPPESSSALLFGLAILSALLLLVIGLGWLRWRRHSLNRQLRDEIQHIKTSAQPNNQSLYQLAVLLRKTMHHLHGDVINALDGDMWLAKLDATFNTQYFTQGRGMVFGKTLYEANSARKADVPLLCDDVDKMISNIRLNTRK